MIYEISWWDLEKRGEYDVRPSLFLYGFAPDVHLMRSKEASGGERRSVCQGKS